eukprot:scaffold83322_cov21-Tisochrysis_lutea.AAC.2
MTAQWPTSRHHRLSLHKISCCYTHVGVLVARRRRSSPAIYDRTSPIQWSASADALYAPEWPSEDRCTWSCSGCKLMVTACTRLASMTYKQTMCVLLGRCLMQADWCPA